MSMEKKTVEAAFRESLQDVVAIVSKLEPLCTSVRELIDVLELATVNETQLKLLITQVAKK